MQISVPVVNAANVAGNEAAAHYASGEGPGEVLPEAGSASGAQVGAVSSSSGGSGGAGATATKMAGATLLRLLRAFTSLLTSASLEVWAEQCRALQRSVGLCRFTEVHAAKAAE